MFIPTPTTPTPTRERRSLLPGQLFGLRMRNNPRSRSPARVNLRATKGSGGNPPTAYLTATKLVPRKNTARSREASVNNSALPLRSVTAPILRSDPPRRSRAFKNPLRTARGAIGPTGKSWWALQPPRTEPGGWINLLLTGALPKGDGRWTKWDSWAWESWARAWRETS